MVGPLWYLVALVFFWAVVPPTVLVGLDAGRTGSVRLTDRRRRWFWAYLFLSVSLAWSTLFLFYPLLQTFSQSFTDFSLTSGSKTRWVGIENYATLLGDPFWRHTLWVTLVYTLATLPLGIGLSLFLATQILKQPARLQTFFKAALYLPGVIGFVVSASVMKWIFHSGDGFANAFLETLGLPGQNWFGDPRLAMPALIAMSWLTANGVGVIIYSAALGNIPKTYYDAAEIDGASGVQTFFHVTWPLAKPTTVFVSVTGLIASFQVFAPALLITGGGPLQSTYFMNYHIYKTFYYDNDFGLASAMATLLMVLVVVVSVINYKALGTDVEY